MRLVATSETSNALGDVQCVLDLHHHTLELTFTCSRPSISPTILSPQ